MCWPHGNNVPIFSELFLSNSFTNSSSLKVEEIYICEELNGNILFMQNKEIYLNNKIYQCGALLQPHLKLTIDRFLMVGIYQTGCAAAYIEILQWAADASLVAALIAYHWSIIIGSTMGSLFNRYRRTIPDFQDHDFVSYQSALGTQFVLMTLSIHHS